MAIVDRARIPITFLNRVIEGDGFPDKMDGICLAFRFAMVLLFFLIHGEWVVPKKMMCIHTETHELLDPDDDHYKYCRTAIYSTRVSEDAHKGRTSAPGYLHFYWFLTILFIYFLIKIHLRGFFIPPVIADAVDRFRKCKSLLQMKERQKFAEILERNLECLGLMYTGRMVIAVLDSIVDGLAFLALLYYFQVGFPSRDAYKEEALLPLEARCRLDEESGLRRGWMIEYQCYIPSNRLFALFIRQLTVIYGFLVCLNIYRIVILVTNYLPFRHRVIVGIRPWWNTSHKTCPGLTTGQLVMLRTMAAEYTTFPLYWNLIHRIEERYLQREAREGVPW